MSSFRARSHCVSIAASMTTAPPTQTASRPARPPLSRKHEGRLIAGVAAGIAERAGVPITLVRVGFVVLAALSGIGIVGYLAAWLLLPREDAVATPRAAGDVTFQIVAIALLGIGAFILLSLFGVSLSSGLIVPLVLLGIGGVVLWHRTESEQRSAVAGGALRTIVGGRTGFVRLLVGGVLVLVGVLGVLVAGNAITATLAAVVGFALVFGPWIWSLSTDYMAERRERIRSEERAEMAAKIHDSVLQTLALIQRSADQPADTVRLARRQERELRSWLFSADQPPAAESLRAALEEMAADVEDLHDVQVELVVVGDAPMSEGAQALVSAMREALVNAAKFSGETHVSAFAEAEDGAVEAFVRDRGVGFDPSKIDTERQGISGSIVARIKRAGGTATVRSAAGEGTEVVLSLQLEES
jgi:signal transduction histidine kinase/phage shock protein PspC (stress-responsive transcriptional regulator)